MSVLTLNNHYTFDFDENKRYQIYFGSNAIGKTITIAAIKQHLEGQGKKVIVFDDKIMGKMIDIDASGNANFLPNIAESKILEEEIEKITSKASFKDFLKNIAGNTTQKFFAPLKNVISCIKFDYLSIKNVPGGPFNQIQVQLIFSKKYNSFSLYDLIQQIDENLFVALKKSFNLDSIISPEVHMLRTEIINENKMVCPVCLQAISKEQLELIKLNIDALTINKNLKQSIKQLLADEESSKIFLTYLNSYSDFTTFHEQFIIDLENSLLSIYKSKIDIKDIAKFQNLQSQLEIINEEISELKLNSKHSKEKDKITEYLQKELDNTKLFKKGEVRFSISKGVLSFNIERPFSTLSKSEQNFLMFLYYSALIMHLCTKGNISTLIDDPFDSYDESNIETSISMLCAAIIEHKENIEYCQIFSHSLRIFNLFQKFQTNCDGLFSNMKWIDKLKDQNNIVCFIDNSNVISGNDYYISDLWLVMALKNRITNPYNLIACTAIIRELACAVRTFEINSDHSLQVKEFYDSISETVIKEKDSISLNNLLQKFKALYQCDGEINDSTTVSSKLENINEFFDESLFETSNNELLSLLTYKYLLILKMRRIIDKKFRNSYPQINKKEIGKMIEEYKTIGASDMDLYVSFFEENEMLLNDCGHLLTRAFSPLFNISVEKLQSLYIDLINLA